MARAKKKTTAKKRTSAKKKPAKKKAASRSKTLRKVPHTQYELVWDASRETCHFGAKSGVSGEVGCGVTDTVDVYTDGAAFYILSVNYAEGYACVEILDGEEDPLGICFAESVDMRKLFPAKGIETNPKDICIGLTQECL
jgi:hypothetical protein